MKPDYVSQEAWDKAQELLKTAPNRWRFNICAYTHILNDGTLAGVCLSGDVCHARLMDYDSNYYEKSETYMTKKKAKKAQLIFNTMSLEMMKGSDIEAVRRFAQWMKDESPVRNFILNDDVDSMMNGGVIIDYNIPSSVRMWICKMFRQPYEDLFRIPIWKELVEGGVHPMLALCYAQAVSADWKDNKSTTHCSCMVPPSTKKQLSLLFIDHVSAKDESLDHWDTSKVFNPEANHYGQWTKTLFIFKGATKKVKVSDGWGGYVMKTVSDDTSKKEVIKHLLDLQKEYVK